MKIAITGKGGVGKTSIAAGLALVFRKQWKKVIAIDADPDANLATTNLEIKEVSVIANKIRSEEDKDFIKKG